jgi:hypothetical protein
MKEDNSRKNAYWPFGARLSVLAGQANTGGRYDLVEGWFFPGAQTPPHRHGAYSGQVYYRTPGEVYRAGIHGELRGEKPYRS